MADQCALRVMRELQQLARDDDMSICIFYDESDVRQIRALIIGPPDTPYALGFYQFLIKIPRNYPEKPPNVHLLTTNRGSTRFGPNLYANGKVCLSILGTWHGQSNEQWSPVQSLETVLRSIQSLLAANPYTLEPGYDQNRDKAKEKVYNAKIHHENLRLTVLAPLMEAFSSPQRSASQPLAFPTTDQPTEGSHTTMTGSLWHLKNVFLDTYKRRFLWYLESYKMAIQEGIDKSPERNTRTFPSMPFESSDNRMSGSWNYSTLMHQLRQLEGLLLDETRRWPALGAIVAAKDDPMATSLRAQFEQIAHQLTQRTEGMVTLELVDKNPFLWRLIYYGRPMTSFDGGVVKIKIYISPNFPREQPRVFLETPLYHVRVSPQHTLIYLPLHAEEMSRHVDGIISSLEEERPPVNPLMTVNPAVSKLCWGSEEEQRQYRRNLRRSVAATLE